MIDVDLARRLKDAGLAWHPTRGDAFAVPDRDLDGEVFVVSDLVVELREVAKGPPVLAFNGTTEWALDSLEAHEAIWLPSEAQLRDVLGDAFEGLERLPGEPGGWAVTTRSADGVEARYVDLDPTAAHARAVLALLALPG